MSWGQHGSLLRHRAYVEPASTRRMCRCGCRNRATHKLMANGVCMNEGCELSMRRAVKLALTRRHGSN
jgi:hypothetical protein